MCVDEWTEEREKDEERGQEHERGKLEHRKPGGNGKGKERQRHSHVDSLPVGWDAHHEGGDVDGDETEVEVDIYGRSIEFSARILDYRSCSPPNGLIAMRSSREEEQETRTLSRKERI
ncbi:hypothetical protein BDQ12DRAFT_671911 [Crucibulum laeve]|nr:hypothetical protein BDQ12DRAFT_671911 [Crucibulum laeve]